VIRAPVYDPKKDGNVFSWVLRAAQVYRERKRIERDAAKEAAAELERLDSTKVEN
jgi:hypothetical protein